MEDWMADILNPARQNAQVIVQSVLPTDAFRVTVHSS